MDWYCREHLFEEFKKEFLVTSSRMLICEPDFVNVCGALYGCYSLEDMPHYHFSKKSIARTEEILSKLDSGSKCSSCQAKAQAIFFDASFHPLLYGRKYGPWIEDLPSDKGRALCRECAFKKVNGLIQANPKAFNDGGGLYTPYGTKCLFASTYL